MPSRLGDVAFWAAVVCCAIAQLFIIRSTFRSTPARSSRLSTGTLSSELAFVALPAVALAILFTLTWREMHPRQTSGAPAPAAGEVAS